jgi:lipopolysaccharide export system protein LptA
MSRYTLFLFGLVIASESSSSASAPEDLIRRASLHAEKMHTDRLGVVEIRRAAGQTAESLHDLEELIRTQEAASRPALRELLCWRLLPTASSRPDQYRLGVESMRMEKPASTWQFVHELFLLSLQQDRLGLLAVARNIPAQFPDRFPDEKAEQAYFLLLEKLGFSPAQAGLDAIAHRNFDSLYALRDLDRCLSREADFLKGINQLNDARTVTNCRDRLRQAYLHASVHLVQRLFALNLLGRIRERDALLEQAGQLKYLRDRAEQQKLFGTLNESMVWESFVNPLLQSEVAFIEHPPQLEKLSPNGKVDLVIEASHREASGAEMRYRGDVHVVCGNLRINAENAILFAQRNDETISLIASGSVKISGIPGTSAAIEAERMTYHCSTGLINLDGNVRLPRPDGNLKLRACCLNCLGELREARSLLDDFEKAANIKDRLALLPRIARTYTDAELPSEVRFLLALSLVRPHLTWHAPYLAPVPDEKIQHALEKQVQSIQEGDSPWQEAFVGEDWLREDITDAVLEEFRKTRDSSGVRDQVAAKKDKKLLSEMTRAQFFWRLDDANHDDVKRASELLRGIREGSRHSSARRWLHELQRNNTVLTVDVTGAYARQKDAPVVLDVRNVEEVTFAVYRVKDPSDLLWVTDRIGEDFVYHDHGLQYERLREILRLEDRIAKQLDEIRRSRSGDVQKSPAFLRSEAVEQWTANVRDLKPIDPYRSEQRWHREENAEEEYFDDACSRFRQRIEKSYRPREAQLSSWQCDRRVNIPGRLLQDSGAYILCARANGQSIYAPILVDPLSMTLGRCRDGVLVQVSESSGKNSSAGADIHATGMPGKTTTDAEGVAFARVFASGKRAIVAHKDGRFAIGGFGRVFDGIYRAPGEEAEEFLRLDRMKRVQEIEREAKLFADRYVVAAYTDRPTYRPGQQVQFKLIVRRLRPNEKQQGETRYRASDFEGLSALEVPEKNQPIPYSLLDGKGRVVANGTLALNEFGTAAGICSLNSEAGVGLYSLRIRVGGEDRLVPDILAVQHYRRPNFELKVAGIPQEPGDFKELKLQLTGAYYFGKSVAKGLVEFYLLTGNPGESVHPQVQLDAAGHASITLKIPSTLRTGKYQLIATLRDESNRTIRQSFPLQIKRQSDIAPAFAELPRFVPVDRVLSVTTSADKVTIQKQQVKGGALSSLDVKNGNAAVRFPEVGWYTIRAGSESTEVFAFGGKEFPTLYREGNEDDELKTRSQRAPRWVNLTDYESDGDGNPGIGWTTSRSIFALFDRQQVNVGDKLKVLIYVPADEARILFTMEGTTISDYHIVHIKKTNTNYHVVEIPIRARQLPNFFLQARIISDSGAAVELPERKVVELRKKELEEHALENPLWCRIDVLDPKAGGTAGKLQVDLTTDRKEYRPGDPVAVSVSVQDRSGKARQAEVSLSAIDESVYTFGEDRIPELAALFTDPHPAQLFRAKTWRSAQGNRLSMLQVSRSQRSIERQTDAMKKALEQAAQANHALEQSARVPELPSQSPLNLLLNKQMLLPVGAIPLNRLRIDFRETATWQPQLQTDANGIVKTTFQLPDSLTRYRLTAVAITKDSEFGAGRANISASLPLSAQLFLPRFAVEQDRFLAVALIHNTTVKDRDCEVRWEVSGITMEEPTSELTGWKKENKDQLEIGTGRIKVSANQSVRLGVWLRAGAIGTATINLRCSDGQDADAETRSFVVQALGREREVTMEGSLEGKQSWKLPKGFIAREAHVVLARGEAARALDGLGYLVDYPYGCVEQTMSRFLPAVAVRDASRRLPIHLTPDVSEKLPDVLAKGLTRLYHFQHPDGGWGWWETDATNDAMSIYVVHGLALCRNTGTSVDSAAFDRGCAYLVRKLNDGKLARNLEARAWTALALAGNADGATLRKVAKQAARGGDAADTLAYFALACRFAALHEEGENLWMRIQHWAPDDAESLSLKLLVQVSFGAPLVETKKTADSLMKQRTGGRWASTQTTATAIIALAQWIGYTTATDAPTSVKLLLDGKPVVAIQQPDELRKMVYRLEIPAKNLPLPEGAELEVESDSKNPLLYTLQAAGTQRLDKVEATGKEVKLTRRLETLDGKQLDRPIRVGEVIAVRLKLALEKPENYLLIEDRRSAGCEFADEHLERKGQSTFASKEFRDDRVCLFFTALEAGNHEVVYYLRAETPGHFHLLPGFAYPMYGDTRRGETQSAEIIVDR